MVTLALLLTLDDAAGELLFGLQVIEKKWTVDTEGAGELLHGIDARAHDFVAPEVEKTRPSGRVVVPEALKVLLEQVGSDGAEVVFKPDRAKRNFWAAVRLTLRFSGHQRVFLRRGWWPSCDMRRASAARTSSKASFLLATLIQR
jgi:hypothetical protein